jgi:hypothetical protein
MNTSNPYIETLTQKGYSVKECQTPSKECQTPSKTKKSFPCVIHGRSFDTEEQYLEELQEFLNGN